MTSRIHSRAAPAWALAAVVGAFTAVPGAAKDAPLCDECKYLPCVNLQLQQAKDMRKMYQALAGTAKDMADYAARAQAEGDKILDGYSAKMQKHPACKYHFPDIDPKTNYTAYREWAKLGWGFEMRDGAMVYRWTAVTDMESCKLREDQIAKSREIVACRELADSTEAHERMHVKQCQKAKPEGPRQTAQLELGGYDAGIRKLEATKARLTSKKCPKPQGSVLPDPAALKKAIGAAGERVQMYLRAGGL
jgi:hypothetical protein